MSLPAGTHVPTKVTRPRKTGGTGGKVTMSARCAKALIGAVPRRRFGYFAAVGKVTSSLPRPAGRNPRGEAQLRTKFFCLLFFQEK